MIVNPKETADFKKRTVIYPANAGICLNKKVIIEVGPGRGDFLFHLAGTNSAALIVGIEIKPKRFDRLIQRIEKRGIKNCVLIQADARDALPQFFTNASSDEIHINFPDPWPKRRHGKHRALSIKFLEACSNALKSGGTISIATDYEPYAREIADNAAQVQMLKSCYPEIIISETPEAYPTFFALKWKQEGRKIFYQKYRRII